MGTVSGIFSITFCAIFSNSFVKPECSCKAPQHPTLLPETSGLTPKNFRDFKAASCTQGVQKFITQPVNRTGPPVESSTESFLFTEGTPEGI